MATAPQAVSVQLLEAIGAPTTAANVATMKQWLAAEGGTGNNWLNVMSNGTPERYASITEGVQATAAVMQQSNMSGIVAAFRANQGTPAIKAAIISSPWDQNHYQNKDFAKGVPVLASTTLPGGALNGAGTKAPVKAPVKGTTSNPNLGAGTIGGSGTVATPSNEPGLFGLTATDVSTKLTGDNTGLLGPDPTNQTRTLGDAVTDLKKMSPTAIAHLQAALYASGHLSTPHWGVLDNNTVDAFVAVAKSAIVNGVSVEDQLNNAMQAGPLAIGGPASTPTNVSVTLPDPAEAAVDLQNAFDSYGLGTPSAAQQRAFYSQLENAYQGKAASSSTVANAKTKAAQRNAIAGLATTLIPVGTNPTAAEQKQAQSLVSQLSNNLGGVNELVTTDVNPTDEATIFASNLAAKTPGAATHAEQSTIADITKSAANMGVQLSQTQMKNIVSQVDASTKASGTPDVNLVDQLVAKQFKMPGDPSQLSGDAATVYNDLSKLAGQYLYKASPQLLSQWVTKAIQNQSYAGSLTGDTEAEFEQFLRQQMQTQMPWMAASTQNFQTANPWTATSGYRTQISDILGLGDPDSVDLTGKYSGLLKSPDGLNPPTMQDITDKILNDPQYGYDESPNGIARGYNIGLSLAKSLGANITGV